MSDRMNSDSNRASARDDSSDVGSSEFQQAVDRLEVAVQELVNSAKGQISDRATAFLDETTNRLEREFGAWARSSSTPETARERLRARRRNRRGRIYSDRYGVRPSRRLRRDREHQKIAGVCAGIANYYGVEIWVVRCIAVTGLLFLPSIVFPAYWIMFFVMGKPSATAMENSNRRARKDHTSSAPEFGPQHSPRLSLRNAQADLAEVELRLRRMESHVTSGQFELQRELNKIDESNHVGQS